MFRFATIIAAVLATVSAPAAMAQGVSLYPNSTIADFTRSMNCTSHALHHTNQSGLMDGALAKWLIFNEGPGNVVVRGSGIRTVPITPFDGRLVTFPGKLGNTYYIGLASAGSANVKVCRM